MKKEFPKLYKRTALGQIQEWSITVVDDSYSTTEGIHGGTLTTSASTFCKITNEGRSNQRDGTAQALFEAEAKWKKQVDSSYTTDITKIDSEVHEGYKPMLAHKYVDHKEDVHFPTKFKVTLEDGSTRVLLADQFVLAGGMPKKATELQIGDDLESAV